MLNEWFPFQKWNFVWKITRLDLLAFLQIYCNNKKLSFFVTWISIRYDQILIRKEQCFVWTENSKLAKDLEVYFSKSFSEKKKKNNNSCWKTFPSMEAEK